MVPPGVCYGQTDLPTHPDAGAQIEAVVHGLKSFAPKLIWSSPAQRCLRMAHSLRTALDAELRCDPRLLEMNFGEWEGLLWDSVPREALDRWAADPWAFAPPGGETGKELVTRVTAIHADILREGQDCVVVTHGGPLKVLRALHTDTTRHSAKTAVAPRISPVCPPICDRASHAMPTPATAVTTAIGSKAEAGAATTASKAANPSPANASAPGGCESPAAMPSFRAGPVTSSTTTIAARDTAPPTTSAIATAETDPM
eukprot:gene1887-1918_t